MRNSTPTPLPRTVSTLVLVGMFTLTAAACSGNPDASTDGAASDGIGARWGECMRAAGLDVPDADDSLLESGVIQSPAGVDAEQFEAASSACAEKIDLTGPDDAQRQKWAREALAVEDCIRENGYPDYPKQREGVTDFSPSEYPRAAEEEFDRVAMDCIAEHSPDTQTQQLSGS